MTVPMLYLGQITIQAKAFLSYLSKNGYEIVAVDTIGFSSTHKKIDDTQIPVQTLYEASKLSAILGDRLRNYRKIISYNASRTLHLKNQKLKRIIEETGIEIVYGGWGSQGLPEIGLAQELGVPTVYEFLTYPVRTNKLAEKVDNFFNKRIVNNLNGRVFSTQRMSDYAKNAFDLTKGENIIFPECYPKKFYFQKRLPLLSESDGESHIVFIGMEVEEVLPQIEEIASKKIHVHICKLDQANWHHRDTSDSAETNNSIQSKFIHQFNRFDSDEIADGSFATFLTQFDAILVTYNFSNASSLNRFANSIPSRFSIALCAGVPIIIPKGYMKGCEDIIDKSQIGFAYDDSSDLIKKLHDKVLMSNHRNKTVDKPTIFSIENNFEKMDKFLKRMINL